MEEENFEVPLDEAPSELSSNWSIPVDEPVPFQDGDDDDQVAYWSPAGGNDNWGAPSVSIDAPVPSQEWDSEPPSMPDYEDDGWNSSVPRDDYGYPPVDFNDDKASQPGQLENGENINVQADDDDFIPPPSQDDISDLSNPTGAESSWATEQAVNGVNGVSPALVKESSSSMQTQTERSEDDDGGLQDVELDDADEEEVVEEKPTFFSRFFGKKLSLTKSTGTPIPTEDEDAPEEKENGETGVEITHDMPGAKRSRRVSFLQKAKGWFGGGASVEDGDDELEVKSQQDGECQNEVDEDEELAIDLQSRFGAEIEEGAIDLQSEPEQPRMSMSVQRDVVVDMSNGQQDQGKMKKLFGWFRGSRQADTVAQVTIHNVEEEDSSSRNGSLEIEEGESSTKGHIKGKFTPVDDIEEDEDPSAFQGSGTFATQKPPLITRLALAIPEDISSCGPVSTLYDRWHELPIKYKTSSCFTLAVLLALLIGIPLLFIFADPASWIPAVPINKTDYIVAPNGAVATDSFECSKAGKDILEMGGNAVDAAIASCLCVGVAHPHSSGIGGGAVINILKSNGDAVIINAREKAPKSATSHMFEGKVENAQKDMSPLSILNNRLSGGQAVAVPGEIKGLVYAFNHHGSGKVSWAKLVEPAINLAERMEIDDYLAGVLEDSLEDFMENPPLRSVFSSKASNRILGKGDILRRPRLRETLIRLQLEQDTPFYTGDIAKQLVEDIRAEGGILTEEDFAEYDVTTPDPLKTTYREKYTVYSAPAPFGGPCVNQALNILEKYDLSKETTTASHLLIEAMKFSFANRMGLGDPEFPSSSPNDVNYVQSMMNNKTHARLLQQRISDKETNEPVYYQDLYPLSDVQQTPGTTHISVMDRDGNAVALTSTINLWFGSKVVSEATGIILNNEMDDFSTPGSVNSFLVPPSPANYPAPGKRPLSSMSPTIVTGLNQKPIMATGASGGTKIITGTLQTIIYALDRQWTAGAVVGNAKIHSQLLPDEVKIEPGVDAAVVAGLKKLGHNIVQLGEDDMLSVEQLVFVDSKHHNGDEKTAASDWQKGGKPAGY